MSNDTAPISTPSPAHTDDEDDLKILRLQESDLDRFATYFDLAFQGNARSITVLVALLRRLCGVEILRQRKPSGIRLQDVVGRLILRLYTRGELGSEAASRFAIEASDQAEHIFSEALPVTIES